MIAGKVRNNVRWKMDGTDFNFKLSMREGMMSTTVQRCQHSHEKSFSGLNERTCQTVVKRFSALKINLDEKYCATKLS